MLNLIKKFLNIENYISELDQFLKSYDKTHPGLSASQKHEIAKHERVARLRDYTVKEESKKDIWDTF